MAIKYDKLLALLEEKGYNSYQIKKTHIMGVATYYNIRNGSGGLDYRTIDNLCRVLEVQPGDLMEYVPDDEPIGDTKE